MFGAFVENRLNGYLNRQKKNLVKPRQILMILLFVKQILPNSSHFQQKRLKVV